MKRLNLFVAAVFALFASACNPEQEIQDSLTTDAADITIPGVGAEEPVTFSSNTDWMITSDKTWVEFDSEGGQSGEITVIMTVGQNPDATVRTATVTIVAGTKTTEFVVSQNGYAKTKETFDVFNKEQTFNYTIPAGLIGITVSEDAKDWIIAPESDNEGVLAFSIKKNTETGDRTGTVTINTEDSENVLTIKQVETIEMSSIDVTFLGTKMMPYSENGYPEFDEYFIALTGNGASVNLAVNAADADVMEVPAGTYTIDADGSHAVGTFSVNNAEQRYTSLTENGVEKAVTDGEITITKDGEDYTIIATLYDASNTAYKYGYEGKIGNIAKDDFGSFLFSAAFKGVYNTYFTTKANEWNLELIASAAPDKDNAYFQWFEVTFFAEAGEVTGEEFPVGTFVFGETEEDASVTYPNGKLNAAPNTFNGYAENPGKTERYVFTGGTITISKDSEGKYTFVFENVAYDVMTMENEDDWEYTNKIGTGSYSATVSGIGITSIGSDSNPYPDESVEFNTQAVGNFQGIYLGPQVTITSSDGTKVPYEMDKIFLIQVLNIYWNYTLQFYINTKEAWEFVANYPPTKPRYCNTPIPDATYNLVTGDDPNSNAKGNNAILSLRACYIQNSYTGTKAYITGGSVSMTDKAINFNLECGKVLYVGAEKAEELSEPIKYTGTITSGGWQFQDQSPKE